MAPKVDVISEKDLLTMRGEEPQVNEFLTRSVTLGEYFPEVLFQSEMSAVESVESESVVIARSMVELVIESTIIESEFLLPSAPEFMFENLFGAPEIEPEPEPETELEYWCPSPDCFKVKIGRVKHFHNLVKHFKTHHPEIPRTSQFYPKKVNVEVFRAHEAFSIEDENFDPVEITPMSVDPSDFVKTEIFSDPVDTESYSEFNLCKITPLNSSSSSNQSSNILSILPDNSLSSKLRRECSYFSNQTLIRT